TTEFKWYLERSTPAGQSTLVRTGDGRITNESFLHWNNREYDVDSVVQLDADGYIVSQKIEGRAPFGADIDETFSIVDGTATWKTPGEGGSRTVDQPAFYVPNEGATIGAYEALVQVAMKSLDNSVALLPTGSARIEKLTDVEVESPDGPVTLSLIAVSGISFTPFYAWFDEDLRLTAQGGGWLGMLPDGWDPAILQTLDDVQAEEDARMITELAGDLAIPADAQVVFENVNVVDVVNGTMLEGHHVRVVDGKIDAVSATPLDGNDGIRVDGAGKTLLPGLWDMHGHLSLSDGILNMASGVVNVRDIGNEHENIMDVSTKFNSGAVIGPNVFRAGFMDKAGPYAAGYPAESLEDALDRVDFFAGHGYLQVKLYSSIEPEWVAPIAERAHGHGLRLSGHIPAFMSAEQAVRAGYNEIQHINMVFLNFLAGDREDTRQQIRFTLYGDKAGDLDLSSDEVQEFLELLKENEVVIDPTAAIFEEMLVHVSGNPSPILASVIDHLPPSVSRSDYNADFDITASVDTWGRSAERQAEMIKLLHDTGIQLVPGTDDIVGFTLHRELELYAQAGIPEVEVLRIATLDSARVTGVEAQKGSIEVGKDADLLLVDGNPLEDINAIRNGVLVMKGDTLFRPDQLYKAIGVIPFVDSVEL
ncbi:MAG: amidohydrolase family protein, partial [Gammaproteobacteria bacterium]|nr:amidohydrolase family protein [Gammaproteobacteria bacterium]